MAMTHFLWMKTAILCLMSPGHDRQDTSAFAINSNWTVSDALSVNSIFTTNRSDTEYSFDEDWAYLDLWLNNMDGEVPRSTKGLIVISVISLGIQEK